MGKYSIFMVLGVSLTLLMLGQNMPRYATEAYENFLTYNARTVAHNIAVSGANICANWIFTDTTQGNIEFKDKSLSGGTYTVSTSDIPGTNRKMINSYSEYITPTDTIYDTVQVILQPSGYSKYAYYSVIEGTINWISGDTIWGPFHTQDYMTIANSPVFYGKATTNKGTKKGSGSLSPIFYGGYQSGVNVPLNTKSLETLKDAAESEGRYYYGDSLRLTFKGDSIMFHFKKQQDTTMLISDYTANGVIMVEYGTLRISGTCHGRVTVASISNSTSRGEIYIDNNMKYQDDPRIVPGAKNIFGMVATNEIYITDNSANNSDVIVQGAMFSVNYGFGAQNYSTRPPSGTIYLLGGITQKQRLAVGTFSSRSGITHGFAKNYKYDTRLYTDAPPFFPTTGLYEVISWRE